MHAPCGMRWHAGGGESPGSVVSMNTENMGGQAGGRLPDTCTSMRLKRAHATCALRPQRAPSCHGEKMARELPVASQADRGNVPLIGGTDVRRRGRSRLGTSHRHPPPLPSRLRRLRIAMPNLSCSYMPPGWPGLHRCGPLRPFTTSLTAPKRRR